MPCDTCGHRMYYNSGGDEWGWPYACSYCDWQRLPEHLRAPERRADYVPYHPKPTIWGRIKQVFNA